MEPENSTSETTEVNSWNSVTPLSKYLAMVLFVALPFIGGWIGYMYAPMNVVGIEVGKYPAPNVEDLESTHNIPDQLVTPSNLYELETQYKVVDVYGSPLPKVVIDDLNLAYREILDDRIESNQRKKYVLEKLTESSDGNSVFFKSFIPASSVCCEVIKLDLKTLGLTAHGGYAPIEGELPSPSNRYIPNVDMNKVFIVDIHTNTSVAKAQVSGNETLTSSYCGYTGNTYDLEWVSDIELEYGVYDKKSLEEDMCAGKLIEKRRLIVE